LSGGVAAFSAFKWQPLIKRCRIRFLFAPIDLRGGNCSKKATTKKLVMHFRDNEISLSRSERKPSFWNLYAPVQNQWTTWTTSAVE